MYCYALSKAERYEYVMSSPEVHDIYRFYQKQDHTCNCPGSRKGKVQRGKGKGERNNKVTMTLETTKIVVYTSITRNNSYLNVCIKLGNPGKRLQRQKCRNDTTASCKHVFISADARIWQLAVFIPAHL